LGTLRRHAIADSVIGGVERLLDDDGGIGGALRKAGLGQLAPTRSDGRIFDRQALMEMNQGEFRTPAARFAVMLGDALSLERQAKAIEDHLRGNQFFGTGSEWFAVRVIEPAMGEDYVFDVAGSRRVALALEDAHATIRRFLNTSARHLLRTTLRPGGVGEDDSRNVIGIQVADVAAAVAADMFERAEKPTREAARDLKRIFDRVFLNSRWV
jgi:hypothetical protein